eukprot:jgi/Botrbrau1/21200/Bobra.39_2s0003.1
MSRLLNQCSLCHGLYFLIPVIVQVHLWMGCWVRHELVKRARCSNCSYSCGTGHFRT